MFNVRGNKMGDFEMEIDTADQRSGKWKIRNIYLND